MEYIENEIFVPDADNYYHGEEIKRLVYRNEQEKKYIEENYKILGEGEWKGNKFLVVGTSQYQEHDYSYCATCGSENIEVNEDSSWCYNCRSYGTIIIVE